MAYHTRGEVEGHHKIENRLLLLLLLLLLSASVVLEYRARLEM